VESFYLGGKYGSLVPKNPDWTTEELILTLELYYSHFPQTQPQTTDALVIELSTILRTLGKLTHGTLSNFKENYRSPDSVRLRCANFAELDPERSSGMSGSTGQKVRTVFEKYTSKKHLLKKEATKIRETIESAGSLNFHLDDEFEELVPEGGVRMKVHRAYERKESNRKKVLKSFKKRNGGSLFCQVCRVNPNKAFGLDTDLPIFDVHHLKPLSEIGQVNTPSVRDYAVLCPTCHRAIHKLEDCSDIDGLITRLNSNRPHGGPLCSR